MLRVAKSKLDGEIAQQLELGQQMLERSVTNTDELERLRNDYYTWDEFNEQLLRSRFSTGKIADGYRGVIIGFGGPTTLQDVLMGLRDQIIQKQRQLQSIRQQLVLFESGTEEAGKAGAAINSPRGTKVFLVHGHDGGSSE